jgi:predicted RNA binding protein YcfA (HicA-like mRNA interferase family)
MTQTEKLMGRFLSRPKDFAWAELIKFLNDLGYRETQAGRTSGSRVRFIHSNHEPITLHKPHPKPVLREYQIKQILDALTARGQI